MENNAKNLVEVQNLKQYFPVASGLFKKSYVKAVDDVSFQIHKGEVLGVVGESGCGKTTTGRSIIKLYDITGGKVIFNGETITVGIQELKMKLREAKKAGDKEEVARLRAEIKEGKKINKTASSRAGVTLGAMRPVVPNRGQSLSLLNISIHCSSWINCCIHFDV